MKRFLLAFSWKQKGLNILLGSSWSGSCLWVLEKRCCPSSASQGAEDVWDGGLGCCCCRWSTGRRLLEVHELPHKQTSRVLSAVPEALGILRGAGTSQSHSCLWPASGAGEARHALGTDLCSTALCSLIPAQHPATRSFHCPWKTHLHLAHGGEGFVGGKLGEKGSCGCSVLSTP